jgi:hypothetical protein
MTQRRSLTTRKNPKTMILNLTKKMKRTSRKRMMSLRHLPLTSPLFRPRKANSSHPSIPIPTIREQRSHQLSLLPLNPCWAWVNWTC